VANHKAISVCIPTYEMRGRGAEFLQHSLDILCRQSYRDFEVVVSDYSADDNIEHLCLRFSGVLDLRYMRNSDPRIGLAANANNAIRHATGSLIKILFQDDFLYGTDALQRTFNAFDRPTTHWLASGCTHTTDGLTFYRDHRPRYNHGIHFGNNTIGSPSVITIRNTSPLLFDINLTWLADCDLYRRYHDAFGPPALLNEATVAIRTGSHQITRNEATATLRRAEHTYVANKYRHGARAIVEVDRVTAVTVSGIDPAGGVAALAQSMRGMQYHEALLISHQRPAHLPHGITFRPCPPTELSSRDKRNTNDYSKFLLFALARYIQTDYALIVHRNAHVLRPWKWSPEFLDYDYIGAPWPENTHFTQNGVPVRVGNGGFSLRSKKLLNALNELRLPLTDMGTGFHHEDGVLCVYYRHQLEEYGIKFAPVDVAARFSLEIRCAESDFEPFGFHDNLMALPFRERPTATLTRLWHRL